jgi:hypothetical protein
MGAIECTIFPTAVGCKGGFCHVYKALGFHINSAYQNKLAWDGGRPLTSLTFSGELFLSRSSKQPRLRPHRSRARHAIIY